MMSTDTVYCSTVNCHAVYNQCHSPLSLCDAGRVTHYWKLNFRTILEIRAQKSQIYSFCVHRSFFFKRSTYSWLCHFIVTSIDLCDYPSLGFTLDSITRAPSSSNISESKDLIPSLQPSRVPELNDLMHLQVSDWNRLGLALKLDSYELDIIEKDHQGDTKTQTLKMFKHWLKTQPNASYEQLIKSLCEVGDKTVANSLCNKYGKYNIISYDPAFHCSY